MQEQDKKVKQRCYLCKSSNPKYKRWFAAIERRNRIQELEAIAKRLQRQLVNPPEFHEDREKTGVSNDGR